MHCNSLETELNTAQLKKPVLTMPNDVQEVLREYYQKSSVILGDPCISGGTGEQKSL